MITGVRLSNGWVKSTGIHEHNWKVTDSNGQVTEGKDVVDFGAVIAKGNATVKSTINNITNLQKTENITANNNGAPRVLNPGTAFEQIRRPFTVRQVPITPGDNAVSAYEADRGYMTRSALLSDDGMGELTSEELLDLAKKYDFNNMTRSDFQEFLIELRNYNVISDIEFDYLMDEHSGYQISNNSFSSVPRSELSSDQTKYNWHDMIWQSLLTIKKQYELTQYHSSGILTAAEIDAKQKLFEIIDSLLDRKENAI